MTSSCPFLGSMTGVVSAPDWARVAVTGALRIAGHGEGCPRTECAGELLEELLGVCLGDLGAVGDAQPPQGGAQAFAGADAVFANEGVFVVATDADRWGAELLNDSLCGERAFACARDNCYRRRHAHG